MYDQSRKLIAYLLYIIEWYMTLWWRRLGEVKSVYVACNFSHFAIYLPKLIKIGRYLTKY